MDADILLLIAWSYGLAGVAHALRCVGTKDLIMVYGTSTTFVPENEGRIAHGVETAHAPAEWEAYFNS